VSGGQGQGTPRRNPNQNSNNQNNGGHTNGSHTNGSHTNGSHNNSKAQARRNTGQNRPPAEPTPAEFWRIAPKAAAAARITPAADPTALVRSLGRPPLDHPGADRYLASVAQRAAGLATALAVAADILAGTDPD
jgi:hypothetical protein